jgi:hypothetical protein
MERVGQTGYAEIVRLAECRSLRLELCLDNVERASRNTRSETAARTSCEDRISKAGAITKEWGGKEGDGPIMLLAVHFFRVDGIAPPRKSGDQVVWSDQ